MIEARVGFTGTRQGATVPQLLRVEQALLTLKPALFVHGGALGADRQAHFIASELKIKVRIRPATGFDPEWVNIGDYEIMPAKPPLERNKDIVNDSHFMLACPTTFEEELRSGTWATIRYCRTIHKPLAIIWLDGTQNLEWWLGSKIPKGW